METLIVLERSAQILFKITNKKNKMQKSIHTPEVTVVIPFYNGASTILETLLSVKSQTFEDFVCVVLNDGSAADQTEQLENFIQGLSDHRFSVVTRENVGLCDNINRHLGEIMSPFIARIDQDDICYPQRLQRQVETMHERTADCCFSGIEKFGSQKQTKYRKLCEEGIVKYTPDFFGGVVHSTMMIRANSLKRLGGYNAEFYPSDDWDLTLRMVQANLSIEYIDEALVKYRFHDTANTYRFYSKMCDARRRSEQNFAFMSQCEFSQGESRRLSDVNIVKKIRHHLKDNSKLCFRRAGGCYLDGRMFSAVRWMILSFLWHPQSYAARLVKFFKNGS